METKQMYIADVNAVFGNKEEPLIKHIDDIVIPALTSGLVHDSTEKTKYFFEDVEIRCFGEQYVLSGILIKDTVLEIKSEYTSDLGLKKTNKRIKSAPYSLFMIYLCNHRMILVKNQDGSPDIRGFSAAFKKIVTKYVRNYNDRIRKNEEDKEYLPSIRMNVAGIKTATNVKETLRDVKKITEMTFSFYPLNSEWDYENVFGDIDSKIRKVVGSNKGKIVLPSPQNIEGVAQIIEETEGMVKTTLKVDYKEGAPNNKKKGTIKDNQISDVSNIDIEKDLDAAYDEIDVYKQNIKSMQVKSKNNILDYEEFVKNKNCRC